MEYVAKRAKRSGDSILLRLVRRCGRTARFDTLSESAVGAGCQRMGMRFWNCVGTKSSSTIEMPQVEYSRSCRDSTDSTAERQVQTDTEHSGKQNAERRSQEASNEVRTVQRRADARVQCLTQAWRIRRAIAAGRIAHDIAKQVATIRENRQDRRTRSCDLPSRGTTAPTANPPSRSSRAVMLEEATTEPRNRKLPQSDSDENRENFYEHNVGNLAIKDQIVNDGNRAESLQILCSSLHVNFIHQWNVGFIFTTSPYPKLHKRLQFITRVSSRIQCWSVQIIGPYALHHPDWCLCLRALSSFGFSMVGQCFFLLPLSCSWRVGAFGQYPRWQNFELLPFSVHCCFRIWDSHCLERDNEICAQDCNDSTTGTHTMQCHLDGLSLESFHDALFS